MALERGAGRRRRREPARAPARRGAGSPSAAGKLYLLTPIGGRTVGAVFLGSGTFAFAPRSPIEQGRLARFEKKTALEAPVTDVVFLFADYHPGRAGAPAHASAPGSARRRARARAGRPQVPGRRGQPDARSRSDGGAAERRDDRSVLRPHPPPGGGPAHVPARPGRIRGGAACSGKAHAAGWGRGSGGRSPSSPAQGRPRDRQITGERRSPGRVRRYTIEIDLPQSGIGELDFAAAATDRDHRRQRRSGPGSRSSCSTSSRWTPPAGRAVSRPPSSAARTASCSGSGWIATRSRARPGALTLSYHGDLIDRFVDFFRIKSSVAWYPLSLEGRTLATLRPHLQHPGRLSARQRRRAGRFQPDRATWSRTRWVTPGADPERVVQPRASSRTTACRRTASRRSRS